nr:RAMP superfamily CRISPR-associated protein [Kineosporia babensis]
MSVGGWGESPTADLPLARNATGQLLIPGTALAGVLRHALQRWYTVLGHDSQPIDDLFGFVEPRTQHGTASRIRFDDAVFLGPGAAVPTIRTGVGIDRVTGSAASGYLYTQEMVPSGGCFRFRMIGEEPLSRARLDTPDQQALRPAQDTAEAIEAILHMLSRAELSIGAGQSKGLGRIRLTGVRTRQIDLSSRKELLSWLSGTRPWQPYQAPAAGGGASGATSETGSRPGWLTVSINWKPLSPVMVRESYPGLVVKTLPLTRHEYAPNGYGRVRLVLPGSSLKGSLRTTAEKIVRTLLERDVPADAAGSSAGLGAALEEDLPGIGPLFGRPPARNPGDKTNESGWRGVLQIEDCLSHGHVGLLDWQRLTEALTKAPISESQPSPRAPVSSPASGGRSPRPGPRPGPRPRGKEPRSSAAAARDQRSIERLDDRYVLNSVLNGLGGKDGLQLRVSDHNSIDRWTGGAADARLFSVLEPVATRWSPLILALDTYRLSLAPGEHQADICLILLINVLREIVEGRVDIGTNTTRGFGQITAAAKDIHFTGSDLPAPWSALTGLTLEDILGELPKPVVTALEHWSDLLTTESSLSGETP